MNMNPILKSNMLSNAADFAHQLIPDNVTDTNE